VIENTHGGVAGVVIARSETQSVTYISPMELVVDDIKTTLGARDVGLPTPALTASLELAARMPSPPGLGDASLASPSTKLRCPVVAYPRGGFKSPGRLLTA
jgi:hypothetical protein